MARPDREAWLKERRAAVRAQYDAESAEYDDVVYSRTSHRAFVDRLLETCPTNGMVLDAPCGAGHYLEQVRAAGRRVVGIDQSAGMLTQARAKGIAILLQHLGLQELAFDGEFGCSMTVDAMENVPPKEWPLVLANLHRAVRPGGHLYVTIETLDEREIDAAFTDSTAKGLPAVRGEVIEGDTAGYHYYPDASRSCAGSRPKAWTSPRPRTRRTGGATSTSSFEVAARWRSGEAHASSVYSSS